MKVYRSNRAGIKILRTYDKLLEQWGCEKKERDIDTPYGFTHVIEWGDTDKKPLVLFHGVGDDSALMWIYNAKALGENFHCFAIDTIGGPGKSLPGEGYNKTFDDVKWIDDVLSKLEIEKAYFAGVSNGGYLTQLYTLERPDKVLKAISLSCSVPTGPNKNPLKTMMKIFLPEALFPTKKNTEKLIKKLSGRNYRVFTENDTIMNHYRALLVGFNNMAMAYHKVRSFEEDEFEGALNRIRDKVVYLVGEEDPFEKLGGKEALISNNMNVRFFEDAGHGLNHELADIINEKIISIFKER